jgi:hypothetical protein
VVVVVRVHGEHLIAHKLGSLVQELRHLLEHFT